MRRSNSASKKSAVKLLAACSLTSALIVGTSGCDIKSFINPGEVGRYEQQPLLLPILHKLDTGIDEPNDAFANATDPLPSDLVYTAQPYVIGPGDTLNVTVSDLVGNGQDATRTLKVSDSGTLNLQLLPDEIKAVGLTEVQLQKAIRQAYKDAKLINDANVTATVIDSRSRTFSLGGSVPNPGEFQITKKDFRLYDALIQGHYATTIGVDYVYIYRREDAKAEETPPSGPSTSPTTSPSGAPSGPTTSPGPDILAPHAWRIDMLQPTYLQVPVNPTVPPAPGVPTPPGSPPNPSTPQAQGTPGTPSTPLTPGIAPTAPISPSMPPPGPATQPGGYEGRYIIIDGKPVLIGGTPGTGTAMTPASADGPTTLPYSGGPTTGPESGWSATKSASQPFVFQDLTPSSGERVIRIPLGQLRNGDFRYNIVIHPGDTIILPDPQAGYYYMGGHVARTGVYQLAGTRLTLKQAIVAAGMLDDIAIPQRTDIIRRIGTDKEVFARVNLDAIFEGKQPDVFLKPDDTVMVGTNILAPFISAIRNGFRFSYGFGFFYDKNFDTSNNNNNNS